jgi:hypothetical protein
MGLLPNSQPHLASTVAAYLPFAGPDFRYIYGLFGAILGIALLMVLFRAFERYRERRKVQRSSWLTYENMAKMKGLSKIEIRLIAGVLRRAKVPRPSQVLSSILFYEKVMDQALDRGWISDDELSHLERARGKLVRTSRSWDGQNRRQFERGPCAFKVNVSCITKDSIDAELKTSYDESDEKFVQAFNGLVAESRVESTRVQDLSAGGVALLAGDKDQFHDGDYLAFSEIDGGSPIDLSPIHGCILDAENMEEQQQVILHVRFLPYDGELRKQVIRTVYEESERAQAEKREKVEGRKKVQRSEKAPAKKPASKSPARRKKTTSKKPRDPSG